MVACRTSMTPLKTASFTSQTFTLWAECVSQYLKKLSQGWIGFTLSHFQSQRQWYLSFALEPQTLCTSRGSQCMRTKWRVLTTWPNLTLNGPLLQYPSGNQLHLSAKTTAFIILKSSFEQVDSSRALGFWCHLTLKIACGKRPKKKKKKKKRLGVKKQRTSLNCRQM